MPMSASSIVETPELLKSDSVCVESDSKNLEKKNDLKSTQTAQQFIDEIFNQCTVNPDFLSKNCSIQLKIDNDKSDDDLAKNQLVSHSQSDSGSVPHVQLGQLLQQKPSDDHDLKHAEVEPQTPNANQRIHSARSQQSQLGVSVDKNGGSLFFPIDAPLLPLSNGMIHPDTTLLEGSYHGSEDVAILNNNIDNHIEFSEDSLIAVNGSDFNVDINVDTLDKNYQTQSCTRFQKDKSDQDSSDQSEEVIVNLIESPNLNQTQDAEDFMEKTQSATTPIALHVDLEDFLLRSPPLLGENKGHQDSDIVQESIASNHNAVSYVTVTVERENITSTDSQNQKQNDRAAADQQDFHKESSESNQYDQILSQETRSIFESLPTFDALKSAGSAVMQKSSEVMQQGIGSSESGVLQAIQLCHGSPYPQGPLSLLENFNLNNSQNVQAQNYTNDASDEGHGGIGNLNCHNRLDQRNVTTIKDNDMYDSNKDIDVDNVLETVTTDNILTKNNEIEAADFFSDQVQDNCDDAVKLCNDDIASSIEQNLQTLNDNSDSQLTNLTKEAMDEHFNRCFPMSLQSNCSQTPIKLGQGADVVYQQQMGQILNQKQNQVQSSHDLKADSDQYTFGAAKNQQSESKSTNYLINLTNLDSYKAVPKANIITNAISVAEIGDTDLTELDSQGNNHGDIICGANLRRNNIDDIEYIDKSQRKSSKNNNYKDRLLDSESENDDFLKTGLYSDDTLSSDTPYSDLDSDEQLELNQIRQARKTGLIQKRRRSKSRNPNKYKSNLRKPKVSCIDLNESIDLISGGLEKQKQSFSQQKQIQVSNNQDLKGPGLVPRQWWVLRFLDWFSLPICNKQNEANWHSQKKESDFELIDKISDSYISRSPNSGTNACKKYKSQRNQGKFKGKNQTNRLINPNPLSLSNSEDDESEILLIDEDASLLVIEADQKKMRMLSKNNKSFQIRKSLLNESESYSPVYLEQLSKFSQNFDFQSFRQVASNTKSYTEFKTLMCLICSKGFVKKNWKILTFLSIFLILCILFLLWTTIFSGYFVNDVDQDSAPDPNLPCLEFDHEKSSERKKLINKLVNNPNGLQNTISKSKTPSNIATTKVLNTGKDSGSTMNSDSVPVVLSSRLLSKPPIPASLSTILSQADSSKSFPSISDFNTYIASQCGKLFYDFLQRNRDLKDTLAVSNPALLFQDSVLTGNRVSLTGQRMQLSDGFSSTGPGYRCHVEYQWRIPYRQLKICQMCKEVVQTYYQPPSNSNGYSMNQNYMQVLPNGNAKNILIPQKYDLQQPIPSQQKFNQQSIVNTNLGTSAVSNSRDQNLFDYETLVPASLFQKRLDHQKYGIIRKSSNQNQFYSPLISGSRLALEMTIFVTVPSESDSLSTYTNSHIDTKVNLSENEAANLFHYDFQQATAVVVNDNPMWTSQWEQMHFCADSHS